MVESTSSQKPNTLEIWREILGSITSQYNQVGNAVPREAAYG